MDQPIRKEELFVTMNRAAELLNCSVMAVRQRAERNCWTIRRLGRRLEVSLTDVLHYHSNKKGILAWEDNIDIVTQKKFLTLDVAADTLKIGRLYLTKLVKDQELEGYVTADGIVMISEASVNSYLFRGTNNAISNNTADESSTDSPDTDL